MGPPPLYTVAVRALCEFTAKQGDLDLRFTPSPSAQEGVAGHQSVAARRGGAHRSEVSLSTQYKQLLVRGRADGIDTERGVLEEVKTYRGELERLPDNHRALHWAQAKVYGWLYCQESAREALTISLVYFDVAKQTETVMSQSCRADELRAFFEDLCERFVTWAEQELAHRARRDASLAALAFPHADFRAGQRTLAESVFKAARLGRCLLAQAPTGIGKTVGTLFPLLKACPVQELDKLFFLSAKNSGKAVALEALRTLDGAASTPRLRVIELVAREKACEHPDKACHGEACPLARGFYDRLAAARDAAVARAWLDKAALREIALAHGLCPYYLGQELVRWCDVIVGDYNHFFDASALLHGLTLANAWRVAVLVDEAHNLVERARAMYSAQLHHHDLRAVRAAAPASLKKPLDRLHRAWNALVKEHTAPYQVLPEPPRRWVGALQDASVAIGDALAESPEGIASELLGFYFDTLQFTRLLDAFDTHSLFDLAKPAHGVRHADSAICLRNVVPAPFLKPRLAAARSTVLFSATLTPWHFYADTLGLPEDAAWLDVQAPFQPEQLKVHIVREVSTRWRDRRASLAPIATRIAAQYAREPGNYLAFFSSFEYLEQAAELFALRHPEVPMWAQRRGMDEMERERFLARFTHDGRGVGFAVLGGSFAEGIDLPGTRLIGAFIATLGLPQMNPVNEEMRRRVDAAFGAGYDYTYLFPGIRKVVQAAGRVIRTPSDRGSVHLIDDRFGDERVRRLLPAWWRLDS